jgi:hypothetical protein
VVKGGEKRAGEKKKGRGIWGGRKEKRKKTYPARLHNIYKLLGARVRRNGGPLSYYGKLKLISRNSKFSKLSSLQKNIALIGIPGKKNSTHTNPEKKKRTHAFQKKKEPRKKELKLFRKKQNRNLKKNKKIITRDHGARDIGDPRKI